MNNKKGSTPIEQTPAQTGESVPQDTPRGFSNKRNILIIAIALVVLIIGGAVTAIAVTRGGTQSTESIMTLAERYLKEENYEQAVIEFQRVIELDPMNVDAYLSLAEAYLGLGDKEKALDVLREGLEATGDPRLQDMIDELAKPARSSDNSSVPQSSTVPVESKPEETNPVFGSMGSATIAGTEIDIATTESLLIINKELYEAGNWKYGDLAKHESNFNSVIYLNDNLSGEDLSELSRLSNLRNLEIDYAGNFDISLLEKLPKLIDLDLISNQISDITLLAGFTNLKFLALRFNQISDITPLAGLTNLKSLDLRHNQISDITPLEGLTNLKNLYLSGTQISDIKPLAGLTNLTYLYLDNNKISDITPLTGLTKLQYLGLIDNQISDITPLAGLTNLKNLGISNNRVSDADKAWIKEQFPSCDIRV